MNTHYARVRRQMGSDRLRWWGVLLLAALGLVGYYGPWVPHKAAGLVVIGVDLAEYVKFLPEVASGQIALRREIFYLPLLAGSMTAVFMASRRDLPRLARVLLALAGIPLALAMLPPAWSPPVLMQPEFRLQTGAILFCLVLVPGTLILRFIPDRLVLIIVALLSVAAGILPAWGFLLVHPAIESLYRRLLPLGWGFWLNTAGFLVCAIVCVAEAIRRR